MNKVFSKLISGALAVVFVGQVMIYGDGNSQGIAHAETIQQIKNDIQLSKNADELAQEFDSAVDNLGKVEYFDSPESGIMMMNEAGESNSVNFAEDLTVSGKVKKGIVRGHDAVDKTPIFVRIFNGDWEEIAFQEISDGEATA